MRKFLLAFLLLLGSLCIGADKSQSLILLQQAAEGSSIRSADAAPFRLRARIRILDAQPINAEYLLIWAAQGRWREEISIGDRKWTRIGGKGNVSSDGDSEQAQLIRSQMRDLDLSAHMRVEQGESVTAMKIEHKDGLELRCLSRTAKFRPKTELCFDSVKAILVREYFSYSGPGMPAKSSEFSDYSDFRGKLFPRLLRTFEGKKLQSEVEVQQLTYDSNPEPSLFESGAQYRVLAGCEFPPLPRPIKLPDPEYPERLRTQNPQKVKLSAVVNETGGVQDVRVTSSAGEFDQYAIRALEKWKFAPATCEAMPVPFQFFTDVNFRTY